MYGTEGRTRTGTAYATAPSRQRVYQFHHFGNLLQFFSRIAEKCYFFSISSGRGIEFCGFDNSCGIAA